MSRGWVEVEVQPGSVWKPGRWWYYRAAEVGRSGWKHRVRTQQSLRMEQRDDCLRSRSVYKQVLLIVLIRRSVRLSRRRRSPKQLEAARSAHNRKTHRQTKHTE